SLVQSTGSAIDAGGISLTGTGGDCLGGSTGVAVEFDNTKITSKVGNIQINGTGGLGAGGGNLGVRFREGVSVTGTLSAGLSITGKGGSGGTVNTGISASISGSIPVTLSTKDGNISLDGSAVELIGVPASGTVLVDTTLSTTGIGQVTITSAFGAEGHGVALSLLDGTLVQTGGRAITLVNDSINIDPAATISDVGGTVTIRQKTDGRLIDLGTPDPGSVLNITDAEINRITAAKLQIGDAKSGAINIHSPIDLTNAPVIPMLHLTTGAGVSETGTGSLKVSNLAITGGGVVDMQSVTNDVGNIAINTIGAVTYVDSNDLSIEKVDGATGVTSGD